MAVSEESLAKTDAALTDLSKALLKLLYAKNHRYGNAALQLEPVFSGKKALSSTESRLAVRLDEKLSRIRNSEEVRVNDYVDLIGYLYLFLIEYGVTPDEIEKLID